MSTTPPDRSSGGNRLPPTVSTIASPIDATEANLSSIPIPQVIEPEESTELQFPRSEDLLRVPKELKLFHKSPFSDAKVEGASLESARANKGFFLTRDLRIVLQVLEAWIEDPDTSRTLWPKVEREMIKKLQLVAEILADWHHSVEAGEAFRIARRSNIRGNFTELEANF